MKIIDKFLKIKPYGRIFNLEEYISKNYGERNLTELDSFTLSDRISYHIAGHKGPSDCLLVSMSTIFEFHRTNGNDRIPESYDLIYESVREQAMRIKAYPVPIKGGTTPLFADNIARRVLKIFGIFDYKVRNSYGFYWGNSSKKMSMIMEELKNERPFTMNISFGDYGSHSVTAIGYKIFVDKEGGIYFFIELADGWFPYSRYIDLSKFNVIASMTKINPGRY